MLRRSMRFLTFLISFSLSAHAACFLEPRDRSGTQFEAVKRLAQSAASLEAFVAALPADLRARAAFAHTTESIQFASPDFPRVVLFTDNGRLLVAYSGYPKTDAQGVRVPGTGSAEVIYFDETGCRWQFHQFAFPRILKNDPLNGPAVTRHDGSGKACLRCHQGQPIWDTYPLWPRFFGGYDDGTKTVSVEGEYFRRFQKQGVPSPLYAPLTGLESFREFRDLGRFARRYLEENREPPYRYYRTHASELPFLVPMRLNTTLYPDPDNGARPLEKLSYELNRLQMVKLTAEIDGGGYTRSEKLSMLAAVLDCQPLERFLPKHLVAGAEKELARHVETMRAKQKIYFDAKLAELRQYAAPFDGREKNFEDRPYAWMMKARLRYLLSQRSVTMDGLSLARQRDSFAFFHSNYTIDFLSEPLAWSLAGEIPDFKFYDIGDGAASRDWCAVVSKALEENL